MGAKQLSATLRERLRDQIDEDKLAEVLVAGLASESARERLDVAKLVLAELHASTRGAETKCTCRSNPGSWCGALEPHGYRSVPKTVALADLLEATRGTGVELGLGEVRVNEEETRESTDRATPSPRREKARTPVSGYPQLLTEQSPRTIKRKAYQPLIDESARWHEEMVHDGLREQGEGLAVAHELTDFQADFLGAKQDLLAARRQLAAAGKAVF